MPTTICRETYYRTSEAAQRAGITRSTLLRWLDSGIIKDTTQRDRRGWRLFTETDIKRIEEEANRVR
jgi:excisionase family DNA binding protein